MYIRSLTGFTTAGCNLANDDVRVKIVEKNEVRT
jgi:hypothetical protein